MTRLCSTNKEALRWCSYRRATIKFEEWKRIHRNIHGIPEGVSCCVFLGRLWKVDKTVIKAVNKWIREFNDEKEKERKKNEKTKKSV